MLAADLGTGPADGPTKILQGRGTSPDVPAAGPLPALSGAGSIDIESAAALRFKAHSPQGLLSLRPLHQIQEQRYSVYWQRLNS